MGCERFRSDKRKTMPKRHCYHMLVTFLSWAERSQSDVKKGIIRPFDIVIERAVRPPVVCRCEMPNGERPRQASPTKSTTTTAIKITKQ